MPRWFRVLLLLQLLILDRAAGVGRVRKKATRTRPCQDLPEETLEERFGRLTVGVLSAFHHALQLEPHGRVNRTCPTGTRSQPDSKSRPPVNLLSISPWGYRLSYDPGRFPRYIPEAYCLCKGCLMGPNGEESDRHRSVPVYAPSVILRRTGSCVGGRHAYTEIYVSIAVGCTCVPRLEKLQDSRNNNQSVDRPEPMTKTQRVAAGKRG